MKKIIIALAISALSASAFAEGISVSGDVNVVTNRLFRGATVSDNKPSVGVNLTAGLPFGFHGDYTLETESFGDYGTKFLNLVGAGWKHDFDKLSYADVGYRRFLFTGGVNRSGISASQNDWSELYAQGQWGTTVMNGYVAGVRGEIAKKVSTAAYAGNNDLFYGFGPFVTVGKTTASLTYNRVNYDVTGTPSRYNNTEAKVVYACTKNVDIIGAYSNGGRTLANTTIPSRGYVGASYKF